MRKKLLSIVLTLCMVLTLLPTVAIPASAANISVTDENSFINALSSVADGGVVQLANDISLTKDGSYKPGIIITNNNSFTLDLNGHKLAKTGNYGAFSLQGSSELTIDDTSAGKTGEISSTVTAPTIEVTTSALTVKEGKISNSSGWDAITNSDNNHSLGTINIAGGLLIGGIQTYCGGTINVSGGKIQATRYGIRGYTTNSTATTINISSGEISSTTWTGIQADTCATIYIKGAAVIQVLTGQ